MTSEPAEAGDQGEDLEADGEVARDSPGEESTGIAGTWAAAASGSFFLFPSFISV